MILFGVFDHLVLPILAYRQKQANYSWRMIPAGENKPPPLLIFLFKQVLFRIICIFEFSPKLGFIAWPYSGRVAEDFGVTIFQY